MNIIERVVMPNGTKIQLEDWSEYNTSEYPDIYGLMIGAYPIAKNTGKYRWIEGGRAFRLAALVEAQTRPYVPDTLYLFCGRRTDRIKGLVWEGDGWLQEYRKYPITVELNV